MKEQSVKRLLQTYLEHEVTNDLDLWPAIQQRLPPSKLPASRGRVHLEDRLLNRSWRPSGIRMAAALCSVILVLGLGFLASPNARAALQERIGRFWMVLVPAVDPAPGEEIVGNQPRPAPVVGQSAGALGSVPAAQAAVGFPIGQPTWLPANLELAGALVESPSAVALQYTMQGQPGRRLTLEMNAGQTDGGDVVPMDLARPAEVAGQPAVYADLTEADGPSYRKLSWSADGRTYLLSAYDLALSEADLVQVAESVTTPWKTTP